MSQFFSICGGLKDSLFTLFGFLAAALLIFHTHNVFLIYTGALLLIPLMIIAHLQFMSEAKQHNEKKYVVKTFGGFGQYFFTYFTILFFIFFLISCILSSRFANEHSNANYFYLLVAFVQIISYLSGEIFSSYSSSYYCYTEGTGFSHFLYFFLVLCVFYIAAFEFFYCNKLMISPHVLAFFGIALLRRRLKGISSNFFFLFTLLILVSVFYLNKCNVIDLGLNNVSVLTRI